MPQITCILKYRILRVLRNTVSIGHLSFLGSWSADGIPFLTEFEILLLWLYLTASFILIVDVSQSIPSQETWCYPCFPWEVFVGIASYLLPRLIAPQHFSRVGFQLHPFHFSTLRMLFSARSPRPPPIFSDGLQEMLFRSICLPGFCFSFCITKKE